MHAAPTRCLGVAMHTISSNYVRNILSLAIDGRLENVFLTKYQALVINSYAVYMLWYSYWFF